MRLGVMFSQGSGKVGNIVINKGKNGQVTIRDRVTPANPRSPAQMAARGALGKSSGIFKNATSAQISAWTAYAATLPQVSKRTGRKVKVSAINAFGGLADKFLLINPAGTVPMVPPTAAFTGDSLTITVTAGTGVVNFISSGATSANTKVEVLLQQLKGKNRTPSAKGYRSKGFVAYTATPTPFTVNVPTGFYAAAYRYVNILTGQETAIVPLTILTVALSVEDGGAAEATASRKKAA